MNEHNWYDPGLPNPHMMVKKLVLRKCSTLCKYTKIWFTLSLMVRGKGSQKVERGQL